jgi:hypothetical protein
LQIKIQYSLAQVFSPFELLTRLIVGMPSLRVGNTNLGTILSIKTYWPFDNKTQWEFARWLLFPQPLSNKRIKAAIDASWIAPGVGFKSLGDFKKRVNMIHAKGGEWFEANVLPGARAPSWAPLKVKFWMRDSLEVLKDIVGDVRLASQMKWAPERIQNAQGDRLYSELWSGNWWWNKQVLFAACFV